jgi:hypothetical protein
VGDRRCGVVSVITVDSDGDLSFVVGDGDRRRVGETLRTDVVTRTDPPSGLMERSLGTAGTYGAAGVVRRTMRSNGVGEKSHDGWRSGSCGIAAAAAADRGRRDRDRDRDRAGVAASDAAKSGAVVVERDSHDRFASPTHQVSKTFASLRLIKRVSTRTTTTCRRLASRTHRRKLLHAVNAQISKARRTLAALVNSASFSSIRRRSARLIGA